ncbi:MAG: LuxR C-terminal-related transcriptional regulator [Ruminococcus sp.]|nr:LuxR C-terminal-related transcriptional regulator [Ruminococcus sp.]
MLAYSKSVVDEHYVRPFEADKRMSRAQSIMQTVYIYGMVGYGKTAFVTDFLGKQKYSYYSAAEDIWDDEALNNDTGDGKRIIVIDDLWKISSDEVKKKAQRVIERLCRDNSVWLILISRSAVPSWLRDLYVDQIFVLISQHELSLSADEAAIFFDTWNLSPLTDTLTQIMSMGDGHPLYMKTAAIRLSQIGESQNTAQRKKNELNALNEAANDIMGLVETRVFDHWDSRLLEFLMDISVMGTLSVSEAWRLTGNASAGAMLVTAKETGSFIEESTVDGVTYYTENRFMQICMGKRMTQKYSAKRIHMLYYRAGMIYEERGDIARALEMYKLCDNYEEISRLLIANTQNHPGTKQYWEVRDYYLNLPESVLKKSPELMAGMSLLRSVLMQDEESEKWYRRLEVYASEHKGNEARLAQSRLLYLDIALPHRDKSNLVDMIRGSMHMADILPQFSLTNNQPSFISGSIDMCGFIRYEEITRHHVESVGRIVEHFLKDNGKGIVELTIAETMLERGDEEKDKSSYYEMYSLINKGRMKAERAQVYENVFVAVGLSVWLAVFNNRIDDAIESLEEFKITASKQAEQVISGIEALECRLMLYLGRMTEVMEWMEKAPSEEKEFCTLERYRYMTKARVYIAQGRNEKAFAILQKMLDYAKKRNRTYILIEARLLFSVVLYRMGHENWSEVLQKAVDGAEELNFVKIISREAGILLPLLRSGRISFKSKDFSRQLFAECKAMTQMYPAYLSQSSEGSITLSNTALKILRLQADGLSIKQIAERMHLSEAGVKYYNTSTYKKLGAKGKADAISKAKNLNVI